MEQDALEAKVGDRMVTVRTLQVDGRKLTLQFFRQIPREDWLDENLVPRTDIKVWGRVHYAIKGEGTEWLLVQVGDQLKRCNFDRVDGTLVNVPLWRSFLEQAIERVAKLTGEVEEKTAKAASEQVPSLKKIHQDSVQTWTTWLNEAKAAEAKARADLDKQIERARVYDVRSSRMADLGPSLEQLFIG